MSDRQKLLLDCLMRERSEKVSPKLEAFRPVSIGGVCPGDVRIKGVRGGRAAGAKSWSLTSLIVQRAQYEKGLRIACLREIQHSLEESVYALVKKTVDRLNYSGWEFTKEYIKSPRGGYFIFRGLKDLRAASQIKGLEGFDIFFIEEAAPVSKESWDIIMPTLMRKEGAELWFTYNPEEDIDPVTEKIWNRNRKDALCIEVLPGAEDNPWWNDGLQHEMEQDFFYDPDEAEHIWNGQPRKQGIKAIIPRSSIRAAMDRVRAPTNERAIGIDVARFGNDNTVFTDKWGPKIYPQKVVSGWDTQQIAEYAWNDIAKCNNGIIIRVDDGAMGGGVTDRLRQLGAKVVPINFGATALRKDKYPNIVSEMWFNLREVIDQLDLPADAELIRELSGRQFEYDHSERRRVEKKDAFKKRIGRSCDRADSLILACYSGYSMEISAATRTALAARHRRR